jgi:hypothetical protein
LTVAGFVYMRRHEAELKRKADAALPESPLAADGGEKNRR